MDCGKKRPSLPWHHLLFWTLEFSVLAVASFGVFFSAGTTKRYMRHFSKTKTFQTYCWRQFVLLLVLNSGVISGIGESTRRLWCPFVKRGPRWAHLALTLLFSLLWRLWKLPPLKVWFCVGRESFVCHCTRLPFVYKVALKRENVHRCIVVEQPKHELKRF